MSTKDYSSFEAAIAELERAPRAVTLHALHPHPPGGKPSNGPIKEVTAQDWSTNDNENPFNWPRAKKLYHSCIPAVFSFVVTFASSVYAPAYPGVMEQFHVSSTVALLPLSLYILGQALGPIIAAPASETYGRRIVLLATLPLFALFILGAGFAQTFAALAACRLLAGIFGSPCLSVGAVFTGLSGPALGPVVGGFAAQDKGWRWTQWCILFLAVAAYTFALPISETYKKIILKRRAVRLCLPPPPDRAPPGLAGLKFFLRVTLTRPLHMLVTEPIVAFFSLYVGFNFAVMYTFYAGLPYVFVEVYHFDNLGHENLPFLALGLGCVLAFPSAILVNKVFYEKQHLNGTQQNGAIKTVAPEHRLYIAMMGSLGIPVGLFWFAWSAKSNVHWIVPIIAVVPYGWGNMCVFMASNLYLQDAYGALYGASATAANNLARYSLGAVFPLFSLQMLHNLGIDWAISLLGFISLALLPLPWVLFKWGPTIRKRSSYEPGGKTSKT